MVACTSVMDSTKAATSTEDGCSSSGGGTVHEDGGGGDGGRGTTAAPDAAAAPAAAVAPACAAAVADAAPVAAPTASSAATVVRGGALSRVFAAAVGRAAGLRRRASRVTVPATAPASVSVGGGNMAEVGTIGSKVDANDKGARDGDGAEAGGAEDKTDGDKNEKDKTKESKEDKDESEKKDEPTTSTLEALKVAIPWVVPRSLTASAMLAVAVLAEIVSTTCGFVRPLLLRYAIDGLSLAAAGATTTAAEVVSNGTDIAATSGASSSLLPAAEIQWLLRVLPNRFTPSAAYRGPLVAIVAYICSRYVDQTMSFVRSMSWSRAEKTMTRDIQVALFAHLHSLSLKWHLHRHTGRVMNVFYSGVTSITDLLHLASFQIFPMLADFVLNVAALWRLGSWRLSALAVLAVSAYGALTLVGTRLQLRMRKKLFKASMREAGRALDSLLFYENVKVFATEAVEVRRYKELLDRQDARHNVSFALRAFFHNGQSLIQTVFVAVGMVMVGRQVMDGTLSVADFVTAQTYLSRIFEPVTYASYTVRSFHSSLLSLRNLVDIWQLRPDILDAPDATALALEPTPSSRGGRVCFDKVNFSYGANSAGALHDISFTVPAGKTTAIVGPTGSGKSTLLRLLLRLFDVSSGRITIDGQDVTHVTQQSLRNAIGIVPQDCHLLRDSIRVNIAYGRSGGDDVPDDAVDEAVEVAQLGDFVKRLPQGLSSVCGERGVLLSGGERQRVAIARMVVRKPAVVVLDESSSSLDSETERAMQSALRAACSGATTLVIAHRLSTVVKADEILVLFEGRIVERGTHDTLRRINGGRYQRMWQLQHGEDGDAATPTSTPGASDDSGVDTAATADAAANGGTQAADGNGKEKDIGHVAVAEEASNARGGVTEDSAAAVSVSVGGGVAAKPSAEATCASDGDRESSPPAAVAGV